MIIDKIENLKNYVSLNPYFAKVVEFLEKTDLNSLENGKHEIDGKDCFVNIMDTKGKTNEEDSAGGYGVGAAGGAGSRQDEDHVPLRHGGLHLRSFE